MLIILALLAADVPPLPVTDLTPTIGFADARTCRLVPEGERIVDAMMTAQRKARPGTSLTTGWRRMANHPGLVRMPGSWDIVTRVVPARNGDTDRGAEIRLTPGAVLHGLRVTSIATRFQQPAESDSYTSRTFTFDAPPEQVRAMMARLGAKVPPAPGHLAIPDPDEVQPGAITIEGKGGRTELTCGWGL